MTWRHLATGSGTDRWLACPASVAMEAKLTEAEKKKYRDEGTKLHADIAAILKKERIVGHQDGVLYYCDPSKSWKEWEQVHEYVQTCIDYMESVVGYVPPDCIDVVEGRLPLHGSGGGGIDRFVISDSLCYLFDYKFGYGVRIHAAENGQLAFYAAAIRSLYPQVKRVVATVIQPAREGEFDGTPHITSWEMPWQTIDKWSRRIADGLEEVDKAESLHAGSHCQFCKARAGCPAHIAYARAAELAVKDGPDLPEVFTPGEQWLPQTLPDVARIYRFKERMTTWFNKAEEFLLAAVAKNPEFEKVLNEQGLETYTKRSNRRFRGPEQFMPEAQLVAELEKRGINPWKKPEMIGIGAAEKAGVDIDDLVYKPEGGKGLRVMK